MATVPEVQLKAVELGSEVEELLADQQTASDTRAQ